MDGETELTPEARIAALERENRALRAANAKLMRERLGKRAAAERPAAPLRAGVNGVLGPLRKLRLWLRKLLLRVLR